MKRYLFIILFFLACFTVIASYAGDNKKEIQQRVAAMTEEQKTARAAAMKARVEQIRHMDKSRLSSDERQALRHELRNMKTEARAIHKGGTYVSFAGVVVLILILVVVL